jgi:TonB family protein
VNSRNRIAVGGLALGVLSSQPLHAWQNAQAGVSAPSQEGRRIEARDGDLILADHDARVRFVRRRQAVLRIIFNNTERWAVVLADFVPRNGAADGIVDFTYYWRQIEGQWPIEERWEGSAVLEDYSTPGFAPNSIGLALPAGRVQFLGGGPAQDVSFADPRALAVLRYRSAGSSVAGQPFDQVESQVVAQVMANPSGGSNRSSTTFGASTIRTESALVITPGGGASTGSQATASGSRDMNAPVRVGGPVAMPRKIHDVGAIYPDAMRASGLSGMVILEIIISPDGSVRSTRVLRGVAGQIDDAAIEAARQWRYEPALLNGAPVPAIFTATVAVRP